MNYYVKRIGQALFTIYAVVTISFGLIRLLPGGPVAQLRAQLIQQQGGAADRERVNRLVELHTNVQPDKPVWEQYIDYMIAVFQGDLGVSMWHNEAVSSILGDALPWTVFLMGTSLLLAFVIGIALGAVMAYYEGSQFDIGSTSVIILLNSIPYYIAAVIMLYFLGYNFGLFPTGGRYASGVEPGLTIEFFSSVLFHSALPIASMVITSFGGTALSMRGNAISVLGNDYLRVARLRGLRDRRITMEYVARNALLPMYTGLMMSIGMVFGGSVILEEIFTYPGVGYYMFQAINASDYPVLMGSLILITIAIVVGILIADLTYGKIDPRVRGEDRETY